MNDLIGGNPPVAEAWFEPASGEGAVTWLASGRDGYLLAVLASGIRDWLVPDPICPVVIEVLRAAGCAVRAYRHGGLADHNRNGAAVALAWDVAARPHEADIAAASAAALVLEDRCLWAGLPADLTAEPAHEPAAGGGRRWVVGSARKWLGTAEGGWLVSPRSLGLPLDPPDRRHAALQLAAAAVRAARRGGATASDATAAVAAGSDSSPDLERASLALVPLAEDAVGTPQRPRAMSRLGRALLGHGAAEVRAERAATTAALAARLGATWTPGPGASALRLAFPTVESRDACRQALKTSGVLAPIHWPGAAWSGEASARAAMMRTLTLPVAVGDAGRAAYVKLMATVLDGFPGVQPVERPAEPPLGRA